MDDWFVRTLTTLLIAFLGWGSYRLVTRWQIRNSESKVRGLEELEPGVPAVLYFTTLECQPCKTMQRPALNKLSELMGDGLQILSFNANKQTELADYWGVLSVPTTFVIDSRGRPRGVNHGTASAEKLLRQLEQAEGKTLATLSKNTSKHSEAKQPIE